WSCWRDAARSSAPGPAAWPATSSATAQAKRRRPRPASSAAAFLATRSLATKIQPTHERAAALMGVVVWLVGRPSSSRPRSAGYQSANNLQSATELNPALALGKPA